MQVLTRLYFPGTKNRTLRFRDFMQILQNNDMCIMYKGETIQKIDKDKNS